MKIDAVITWVDGDDPAIREKRMRFGNPSLFNVEDIAGDTRYKSVGEIFWLVASINRFAPWINKIWIVTDNQDPCLDDFLNENFPDGCIPYEIVDHKVIFRGYEQYLPTFNSISIESMTWRIPGLSDAYIVFNDDLMLGCPISPEDFFGPDGTMVVYGKRYSMMWMQLKLRLGKKLDMYMSYLFNAVLIAGSHRTYLKTDHTPRGLCRSWFEDFFSNNEELLIRNIKHRFRDLSQYSSELVQYSMLDRQGKCVIKSFRDHMFYMKPKKISGYVDRKLRKLSTRSYKFCCFNSIEKASPDDLKKIISWVKEHLNINF